MKRKIIHTASDKLFKNSLKHPKAAREFLDLCLTEALKKDIDFNVLEPIETDFIDESLKLCQADVLFKTRFKDKEAYVYVLVEQESGVDKLIAFWLMKYMMAVWEWHIKTHPSAKSLPLPVIIPIVFYTGDKKYTATRNFTDLFGEHNALMANILNSPFPLVEADKIAPKAIDSHLLAGTMAFIIRKRFKKHLLEEVRKVVGYLNQLQHSQERGFLLQLLHHILNIDENHSDIQELVSILKEELSPDLEKDMTTLAEHIEQRGMETGMEKGRQEGRFETQLDTARNMLKKKFELVVISEITGLPIDTIKTLQ